jgi:hypothetical protein
LVFYGVFGRPDGLIGCGGSAGLMGLMGLMGLIPNWDNCIANMVLSFSAVSPLIHPIPSVQYLIAEDLLIHLVIVA